MRLLKVILLAVLSAIVASAVTYVAVVRPRVKAWGFDPSEAELPLPGDDLIPEPTTKETRGITIDAPISKVWPWLVQMGFGRGGWYSYEVLDSKGKSADTVLPEFQDLKAGEIMHIDPFTGFLVKTVEADRALVLYTDTELARSQAEKAATEATDDAQASKATGAMSRASYPDFAATWAFFLQPAEDGKTRLIERFRAKTPGSGPANAVLGEIMGTGIVLMTRKQMIGIKERVEHQDLEQMPDFEAPVAEQFSIPVAAEPFEAAEDFVFPEAEPSPVTGD